MVLLLPRPDEPSALRADDDPDLDAVRRKAPPHFLVGRAGVFIVAGDLAQDEFDAVRTRTVLPCAEALHKAFFTKQPTDPIVIYLFAGDESYRTWAKKLFNETSSSPYGYFVESDRRMVMNIRTGTGTLVHEMVHALIRPDFPDAPTWLNEGLGSLFEQCRHTPDGTLEGLINWRYAGLLDAIKKKGLLPLKALVQTSDAQFRGPNEAVNYAQARYFCMFLQEKGLLRDFYKTFRDRYAEDKTGEKFLRQLLGKDLGEVEKEWLLWVRELQP